MAVALMGLQRCAHAVSHLDVVCISTSGSPSNCLFTDRRIRITGSYVPDLPLQITGCDLVSRDQKWCLRVIGQFLACTVWRFFWESGQRPSVCSTARGRNGMIHTCQNNPQPSLCDIWHSPDHDQYHLILWHSIFLTATSIPSPSNESEYTFTHILIYRDQTHSAWCFGQKSSKCQLI